jgi:hypothetical protein
LPRVLLEGVEVVEFRKQFEYLAETELPPIVLSGSS